MLNLPPFIAESCTLTNVCPENMDRLWAGGWRHFGRDFFRYSMTVSSAGSLQVIQPLRIELAEFRPSKSQRRVLRRNHDAEIRIRPAVVDDEREAMFLRHRERFTDNIPDSLRTFMPEATPDCVPCECRCVEAIVSGRLIAVSYFDVGATAVSSVYAMFEPEEAWRSPGILTMLAEIEWAVANGRRLLYPGYATVQPSHYDYKKLFRPLHCFDWRGHWLPLEAGAGAGGDD